MLDSPDVKEALMGFALSSSLRCNDRIADTGAGVPLIVNRLSYGRVPTETVLDRTAVPVAATLTSDGRGYIAEWHRDAEVGDSVYVERWTAMGREFHGFIDSESRRIVQAG